MPDSILSLTPALDGMSGQRHARPLYTQERDPAPIVEEAGWIPGPVWKGTGNFARGIRFPRRRASSKSLYLLRYTVNWLTVYT